MGAQGALHSHNKTMSTPGSNPGLPSTPSDPRPLDYGHPGLREKSWWLMIWYVEVMVILMDA